MADVDDSINLQGPDEPPAAPIPASVLDVVLSIQLVVAWAGEGGEESRLGWWRTDLASEFGGQDLFQRLLPRTWRWAVLQAIREAARRIDDELRSRDPDPERLSSLYQFGFSIDEQLEQRLVDLGRAGVEPGAALPMLGEVMGADGNGPWSQAAFAGWLQRLGSAPRTSAALVGRCLAGPAPDNLEHAARQLAAALAPLSPAYPAPHYRSST